MPEGKFLPKMVTAWWRELTIGKQTIYIHVHNKKIISYRAVSAKSMNWSSSAKKSGGRRGNQVLTWLSMRR